MFGLGNCVYGSFVLKVTLDTGIPVLFGYGAGSPADVCHHVKQLSPRQYAQQDVAGLCNLGSK